MLYCTFCHRKDLCIAVVLCTIQGVPVIVNTLCLFTIASVHYSELTRCTRVDILRNISLV